MRPGPLGFLRRPRGCVDFPDPGAELPRGPVHINGWCLFPGTTVARVEVRLNGGQPERARLAMERDDIRALTHAPAAPISGFEHKSDLAALPADTLSVRIDVTAHAMDGRVLHMAPVEFVVGPPEPAFSDATGATIELRARSIRPLRPKAAGIRSGPPRLLAFTHVLTHGGASLYLMELLGRLARDHGFHCEVVTLADGPLRAELEESGIAVHVTDSFPVATVRRYESHVAELVAWSAAGDFDAVLVNTLGSFAGADVAGRLGLPAVWSIHESFPLPMFWQAAYAPGTLHPYVRARAEQALANAAAAVFPAEATRRLFLTDADPDRLAAIPYGIELEAIDAAARSLEPAEVRRRLGIEPDAQVVLCLGSIEARKSQAMLTAAFAQIADRHPRAQLVLVGATDDAYSASYGAALREFVERAGLAGRVRIEPVTDDPYRWHTVADALACASDIESLPRVIVEAMVFGTPVLSTRVFGVPELIEDGRTGYLCEMRDAADLCAGLDRILSAPAGEIAAVTRAAETYARARHDPRVYAAKMAALITELAVAPPVGLPSRSMPRSARG